MRKLNYLFFLSGTLLLTSSAQADPHKQVIVGSEDTVYGIAHHNGIPTKAVVKANNLKPPYVLKPGQVLNIPSPNEHIVGDGETLQSIAEDYGVKFEILASENGLSAPYFITPGERINIPSRDTTAMSEAFQPGEEITTVDLEPIPSEGSQAGSSLAPLPPAGDVAGAATSLVPPTVGTGTAAAGAAVGAVAGAAVILPEELASEIAREKDEVAPAASVDTSKKKPVMGDLAKQAQDKKTKSAEAPEKAKPGEQSDKKAETANKPDNPQKTMEDTKVADKDAAKTSEMFIWPVNGKVINKFSPGGKNDGIDIQVSEGTLVKAAADGTVMYAGNELKGFGNLLLIKHQDGWVTAYAHNSSLLVKKGDKVKQGDKVAKSGVKKDNGASLLHFEIRKVKQPIDPLTKLK